MMPNAAGRAETPNGTRRRAPRPGKKKKQTPGYSERHLGGGKGPHPEMGYAPGRLRNRGEPHTTRGEEGGEETQTDRHAERQTDKGMEEGQGERGGHRKKGGAE